MIRYRANIYRGLKRPGLRKEVDASLWRQPWVDGFNGACIDSYRPTTLPQLGASVGLCAATYTLLRYRDDNGTSQWAVLLDPNEAAFGIIPVVPAEAIPPADAVPMGSILWLDLTVSDASATRNFYQQVVEWSVESVEMDNGGNRYVDHNMLCGDGTP